MCRSSNVDLLGCYFRFAMEVDGIFYIAQVRQKEKAWRMYKEARARNQTAGLVDVEARHSNRWEIIAAMIDLRWKYSETRLYWRALANKNCLDINRLWAAYAGYDSGSFKYCNGPHLVRHLKCISLF